MRLALMGQGDACGRSRRVISKRRSRGAGADRDSCPAGLAPDCGVIEKLENPGGELVFICCSARDRGF